MNEGANRGGAMTARFIRPYGTGSRVWPCVPGDESPGCCNSAALRRVPTASAPHISHVVFDTVPFQDRQEFFLERFLSVVLHLGIDVTNRRFNLRDADAERTVSFLPGKAPQVRESVVDPFRRAAF